MSNARTSGPKGAGDKKAGDKLESLIDRTITPGGADGSDSSDDDVDTLKRDPEDK